MNFLNEFVLLLKARYPIIYIVTNEEERLEYLIKYCAKKYVTRTYYSWDFIDGYQGNPNDTGFAARNPLEALDLIDKLTPETASLFVLKDYDNFLKDFSIIRKLKNLSRTLKTQPKNIAIITAKAVVNKYSNTVLEAIDPSFTIFDKEDMPETKEKKTRGTTINKSRFLNIWPPRLNRYFSIPEKID